MKKQTVIFVGDCYCAGNPKMGISEWETNIWKSLESTELVDVGMFHMDKHYFFTGNRGDAELIERIKEIKPDYVVMILYKMFASDQTVIEFKTLIEISKLTKIISIWGDLEAIEQQSMAKIVEPYVYKVIGTANKSIVEGLGYTYMHVPKDPRVFNNPNKQRDIDVVFSGSYGYGREERTKVLQYLVDNGVSLVLGGSEGGDHFTTEEYANRYKHAKMSISFSRARGKNVVNARPFEVFACGSLLLEQKSEELAKLYTPGVDYVEWISDVDLFEKIRYYLEHEEERLLIANSGQKKTEQLYSAKTFWDKTLNG